MALQSVTEIFIGSTAITSFKRFVLDQGINAHHFLNLECRTDVLENLEGEISNSTKNYLGETLTLQVSSLSDFSGYKTLEFKGVVTSVANKRGYNNENIVTIKAESPTVLCDDGPHYNSFLDKSLSHIIALTLQGYDTSKLSAIMNPQNSAPVHYSVQHKESNWRYASRLAMQYSEWLYYDGKKLIFGQPEDGEDVVLTYGHDLHGFSLDLVPLPNNFNYFTNDYLTDEKHEKKTSEVSTGSTGYSSFTSERGNALYAKETNVWVNGFNDPGLKQRMDTHVEQQKKAVETQQVRMKGDSDNPGVGIGKIIDIQGENASHGRYRVIKVRHSNNENGQYHNTFEALSADMDVFPDTNFEAIPKSDTQTAVVMENSDPDGLARIKVQFPWQKPTGVTTPWIRVVTPHGGGDKGFHFIPEVGEEVLVGFEGANAERPYMLGSLYNGNGKAESWKTEKNDIKAIKTRSGHTLSFSDEAGKETITILDSSGNSIILDTSKSEITISAPKKITLSSEEIEIKASKKVFIEGTNNVEIKSQEILSDGSTKNTLKSASQVNVESPNTNIKGDTMLKLEGATTNIDGTAMTNVKGGMLNLNCS
ncbi:phage baseplate assembly protein V [Algibacter sp. TI.3.09]|uniref:type VI secretion system Vgr family protein n=1 Tax=Algibacter sp. TI.3.09 TaxID=3121298 RepID=UPI00311EFB6A